MNVLILAMALLPWAASAKALFTRIFLAISVFSVEMQLATVTGTATLRTLIIVNVLLSVALIAWQWLRDGAPFTRWSRALLPIAPWPFVAVAASLVLVLNLRLPLQAADPYHLDRVAQIERTGTLEYNPAGAAKTNIFGWLYELVLADVRQIPMAGPALVHLHGVFGLVLVGIALAAAQTWLRPWPSRWPLVLLFVIPPLFHALVLIKNDLFLALPAFVALVWLVTSAERATWTDAAWAAWLVGLAVSSKLTNLPLALALVGGVVFAQRLRDWRPLGGLALGGLLGGVTGGLFFTLYANAGLYGDPFAREQVQAIGNVNAGASEALVSIVRFGISLFDLGLVTQVLWPGRGGWGGTFGLPLIWALAVLVFHYRLRAARWALWVAGLQFLAFATVFPDADVAHRIVLAPALLVVAVSLHVLNEQDRYRRPATLALGLVLVLTSVQVVRSALLYLTGT
ncbi:MAG: hypothetical protein ABL971_08470 [Vicinamibacterales bacterium]